MIRQTMSWQSGRQFGQGADLIQLARIHRGLVDDGEDMQNGREYILPLLHGSQPLAPPYLLLQQVVAVAAALEELLRRAQHCRARLRLLILAQFIAQCLKALSRFLVALVDDFAVVQDVLKPCSKRAISCSLDQ